MANLLKEPIQTSQCFTSRAKLLGVELCLFSKRAQNGSLSSICLQPYAKDVAALGPQILSTFGGRQILYSYVMAMHKISMGVIAKNATIMMFKYYV